MNEGVQILLERIKTHPEEFMKGGRWVYLLSEYSEYIPEELKPITDKVRGLVKDEFTRDVMKELLHAENQEDDEWIDRVLANKGLTTTAKGWAKNKIKTTYGRLAYDSIEKSS